MGGGSLAKLEQVQNGREGESRGNESRGGKRGSLRLAVTFIADMHQGSVPGADTETRAAGLGAAGQAGGHCCTWRSGCHVVRFMQEGRRGRASQAGKQQVVKETIHFQTQSARGGRRGRSGASEARRTAGAGQCPGVPCTPCPHAAACPAPLHAARGAHPQLPRPSSIRLCSCSSSKSPSRLQARPSSKPATSWGGGGRQALPAAPPPGQARGKADHRAVVSSVARESHVCRAKEGARVGPDAGMAKPGGVAAQGCRQEAVCQGPARVHVI